MVDCVREINANISMEVAMMMIQSEDGEIRLKSEGRSSECLSEEMKDTRLIGWTEWRMFG